jgi:hypothetical protein
MKRKNVLVNVVHFTVWSEFHKAHFECSPQYIERPYKLTHLGAERILKREYDMTSPNVTRIETATRER